MKHAYKILLFCLLIGSLPSQAALKLISVTIRQGNGAPRMLSISAKLIWRISNSDAKPATATLQLRPTTGESEAIFSREITVPPQTELIESTEIVLADTTEYLAELLQNGNRIQKETIPIHAISSRHYLVALLTDSTDNLSLGFVQKNNQLSSHIQFLTHSCQNAPSHWGSLCGYSAVILLSPDLSAYSVPQMLALIDFVQQGGTLIIGGPDAAFAMKGTLLEELLPFDPIGQFTTDGLSDAAKTFRIKEFKEPPEFDQNGVPTNRPNQRFLNALLHDDAVEILSQGGRTAVARKYVGRGTVLGLVFQPFELTRSNELFVLPIWEMLLSNSRFHSIFKSSYEESYANHALQQMQGYSIPSVSTIAAILLIYLLGSAIILAVMFKLRRHSQGWLLVCLFGVCVTAYTMARARHITTAQANFSLANLSLSNWDGKRGATRNTTLFLSRSDLKPEVTYNLDELILRPQPKNNYLLDRGKAMPSTPLWFKNNGKNGRIEKFTLQQMRPRIVTWFSQGENHLQNHAQLPEIDYTDSGVRLKDWKLPDELKATNRAILLMPNAQRNLHIANGIVSDTGTNTKIEADTLLTAAIQYLAAMPVQTTTLALIAQQPESPPLKLAATDRNSPASVYNYDIVFVNARLPKGKKPAFIDKNMLDFDLPANSALRLAIKEGKWQSIQATMPGSRGYELSFHIPNEMAIPSPEKITFNFDLLNTNNSMSITPVLIACDGSQISSMETQGPSYIFYPAGKAVISPITSSITFSLVQVSKNSAPPQNLMTRACQWQIRSASAEITLGKP